MAVSKVILNGDTLIDVTQDSVTAGTLLSGETATGADGVRLTGSATIPQPSSTTPAMDGTAAAGTSTDYARADHVHPTDTSRQAALVSGTNIKTINGDSILGSGDLTVGGSVSMTEEEVDAAVRAAWPVYTITNNASSYATVDMTSAGEYETVTVTVTSLNGIDHISVNKVGGNFASFSTVGVHTFVMPASNVTLTAVTGGGDN